MSTMTTFIDTETLNPSAALLAENQVAILESIHERDDRRKRKELAEWIGSILGEYLDQTTLLYDLSSGVRLLHLAKSIQLVKSSHLKDSEYSEAVKYLCPEEVDFTDCRLHRQASHIAKQRSNITKFLEWCRNSGVPAITLFESGDLVNKKNSRQVTTCLLYVSRIASTYGIEPPSSVKEEMEKEARLSGKNNFAAGRKSLSIESLLIKKPTIKEHDEDCYVSTPTRGSTYTANYGRTSTPSSANSLETLEDTKPQIDPILPMQLDFEHGLSDAVIIDTVPTMGDTKLHFEKKTFIEDVEIREMQDMVIVEQLQFHPIDVPVDHSITTLDDGTKIVMTPAFRDINENTDLTISDSSFESSSSSENEYFTAQNVVEDDEAADLRYHTSFIDDVSDDVTDGASDGVSADGEPKLTEATDAKHEYVNIDDVTVTSSEDIPGIDQTMMTSPYMLYRVPADIVVERHEDEESSIESTTDVESYISDEVVICDVTYNDIGVGTDDLLVSGPNEIMINFPPYFEISSRDESKIVPITEYIVAPTRNEPIYTVSTKSKTTERTTHRNDAYERDEETHVRPSREYISRETRQSPMNYQQNPNLQPATFPRSVSNASQSSNKGTQTHVSLTQDIVRIINEMEDIPRIRTASSSAASCDPNHYLGNTIVMRAQYQQTLPASDRDVVVVQAIDLQSTRPPRGGSVNSSTRHKTYDTEAASPVNKAVRRSLVRRASSVVSEQFEKAVVVAKKYKKQIAITAVLVILVAGVLAAMLAIFPLT